jgi:hypothetical protein
VPPKSGPAGGNAHHRPSWAAGLDAAGSRSDLSPTMALPRFRLDNPLLPALPLALRRLAGFWLLALTLWLASVLALFR